MKQNKNIKVLWEDFDNQAYDMLPIRKGCGSSLCACRGTCKEIIGYISREDYTEYIKSKEELENSIKRKIKPNVPEI